MAVVLLKKFDWRFAAVTFVAVALYIGFTFSVSEWRIGIRRRANELDSKANSRAIDSLLNYETVKYFGNEDFEARRYDENLQKYETAAVQNEASLGLLNIGQSLVIAAREHFGKEAMKRYLYIPLAVFALCIAGSMVSRHGAGSITTQLYAQKTGTVNSATQGKATVELLAKDIGLEG